MPKKTQNTQKEMVQSYLQKGYVVISETKDFIQVKKPINHALHIILGFFTLGFWFLGYLIILSFGEKIINIEK